DAQPAPALEIDGDLALEHAFARAGEAAAVHEHRAADAARLATGGDRPLPPLPQVVAGGEGPLDAGRAAHRGTEHLTGGRRVAHLEQVLALELAGIAPQLARDAVEVPLHG